MMRLGIRIRCNSTTSSMIHSSNHDVSTTLPGVFVQSLLQSLLQSQSLQRVSFVRTRTTTGRCCFLSSTTTTTSSSYRRKSNLNALRRRRQPQQPSSSSSRYIPMWNGKPIPFHINDLQHLPSSSSLSLHNQQQYHHYYGNDISSSSSSSSSASLQILDDDFTESMRSEDDDDDEEDKNHPDTNDDDNDDDRLIVVLDLDECLIHSHFSDSSMDAALFTHQLQQLQHQHHHRMKESQSQHSQQQSSLDSFRIVLPNHNNNNNPIPSHFSHRNNYYQQQQQYNSSSNNYSTHHDDNFNNTHVHVFIRPGCIEFLAQVTQLYPTYIYTAARSIYANPILDHLSYTVRTKLLLQEQEQQPTLLDTTSTTTTTTTTATTTATTTTTNTKKCIFQGRFYREHCIYDPKTNQYYKDLTQLHRHNRYCTISSQTHKMVLIDNNPISLLKNPHNGILVDSFYGPFTSSSSSSSIPISSPLATNVDPTFTNVLQLLQELSILPDVRPKIAANQKLQPQVQLQLQPPVLVSNTTKIVPTTTTTNTTSATTTTSGATTTTTTTTTKKATTIMTDISSTISSYIHI